MKIKLNGFSEKRKARDAKSDLPVVKEHLGVVSSPGDAVRYVGVRKDSRQLPAVQSVQRALAGRHGAVRFFVQRPNKQTALFVAFAIVEPFLICERSGLN